MARKRKAPKSTTERVHEPEIKAVHGNHPVGELSSNELRGLVCNLICEGVEVSRIQVLMKERYGVNMTRQRPYQILREAAEAGNMSYHAPRKEKLTNKLKRRYAFLKLVEVIDTRLAQDISFQVAQTILEVMKDYRRPANLSIAFAGGSLLRLTARRMSDLLRAMSPDLLPRELTLRALSSGLDSRDMTSQPNAIFSYFTEDHLLPLSVSFVGLPAPGLVTDEQMKDLTINYPDIRKAFEHKRDIDILVTSAGGCWAKGHSALYKIYNELSPASRSQLDAAGCIGDLMWRPFGENGPLQTPTSMRVMTLVELEELSHFVKNNKRVILSIAPCGECGRTKAKLLRAILSCSPPLITDLIADSRSVAEILT